MSQSGLQVVSNASEMFLTQQHSDSNVLAGLAIAVIMDGTRTFLVEIQVIFLMSLNQKALSPLCIFFYILYLEKLHHCPCH